MEISWKVEAFDDDVSITRSSVVNNDDFGEGIDEVALQLKELKDSLPDEIGKTFSSSEKFYIKIAIQFGDKTFGKIVETSSYYNGLVPSVLDIWSYAVKRYKDYPRS